MTARFLYPVDTDQFEHIRESGKVYVDKTDMVFNLASHYQYVFLSRPRRFGKSLLCNTFKAYFQGKKELFEGLKMMELEKEWKTYPVLHFIMSGLKNVTVPEAKGILEGFLRNYERIYGRDAQDDTPGARFRGLIQRAYEQSGEKVVVILDEYDAPIMRLLHQPAQRDEMRKMLREFYQVLKDESAHLRFVFITGVAKFSQLSIFSELNNLKNISMMPEYSGLCGITKNELETTLRPSVEDFASNNDCSVDEAYQMLKQQYDGYHFCPNSQDVFAPFSLLNAFNDQKLNSYWFESGTTTALVEQLQYYPKFNALDYDGVEVDENQFNIPIEGARTPIPLLYQSGYLSIDRYDSEMHSYWLHFPNKEVRLGMVYGLAPLLIHSDETDEHALIRAMARGIFRGDLSETLSQLRAYIGGIPYDIITREEWENKKSRESFFKMLIYIVFSMLNSKVTCEHKGILGRADVVIQTAKDVFVLELKVDGAVETALQQIDDKGYAIAWSADGRRVVKCGVVISSEARNITRWRLTDEQGTVLEDQDFTTDH